MKTKYTKEKLEEVVKKSKNFADVLNYFNLRYAGGSHKIIKNHIANNNIDISHFETSQERIKRLRKSGKEICNSIQTNATCLDDNFLDFIEKENDFYLGFSLDGPKEINDKTRVYKSGKCYSEKWKFDVWGIKYTPDTIYTAVIIVGKDFGYENGKLEESNEFSNAAIISGSL